MNKKMLCCKCKTRPAVIFISKIDGDKTTQEGFCLKCAMEMNIGPVKQMLENMGITEDEIESVTEQFGEVFDNLDDFQPGGAGTMPFMQNLFGSLQKGDNSESDDDSDDNSSADSSRHGVSPDANINTDSARGFSKNKGKKKSGRKFLDLYCTDLTKNAREGKIDRIIGRDTEIYRTIQILCRRTKNNPCLIGEPGVGKTAIAEGLAMKIASGDIPAKLADKEIHLLDLTALVAGTQFRGQFESRIKGLIEEVKSEGNIILFIDEVHTLVGTGDAEGSMNAANIMKPSLSRGEIQVVGATTFTEYRKYIEKDAALERRFQPVKVDEPSIEDCCKMLVGVKSYYEDFHHVKISDSLVFKAVSLSERYITERFLPDKAIDLLDEACTCANLRNPAISEYEKMLKRLEQLDEEEEAILSVTDGEIDYEKLSNVKQERMIIQRGEADLKEKAEDNAVIEGDLARVINLWTGIPTSKIIESDMRKLSGLEAKLKSRIIGQDEAVEALCSAIKRSRVQISLVKRPASFIFVGPTGVGKTELVKQLAAELFETPETLIRLDMSEFMEKHSVSRLIGSPPGYVGYDEAGQLTEKVRRKPYSVILFDEIEKAHPDVLNILLQILDEGKTSDAQGRVVSFANAVIIMTSNAGSQIKENALGFNRDSNEASKDKAMKALKDFLRPEFIGRVDEIILFNNLTEENLVKIADILIDELGTALSDKGIKLVKTPDVCEVIAGMSVGGGRGARDIRRSIRKEIEDRIADILIECADVALSEISVSVEDGKIVLSHK